jgi:hypothetical protein
LTAPLDLGRAYFLHHRSSDAVNEDFREQHRPAWPSSAQNFSLQTTTNLADPNSWVTLTNLPAIVNLQNTVTNPIAGSQGYYRLIQTQTP